MSEPPLVAVDASVGVKWFKAESGSDRAGQLYVEAVNRRLRLCAPTHFVHEVLSVVRREMGSRAVIEAWGHIQATGLDVVPLTDEVIAEAARQCDLLGCSFYDSLAPACASLLGATLASADAKAHGAYPAVEIVG